LSFCGDSVADWIDDKILDHSHDRPTRVPSWHLVGDDGVTVLGLAGKVGKLLITANQGAITVLLEEVRAIWEKFDRMNEWVWN
jgi:hypothetical protein